MTVTAPPDSLSDAARRFLDGPKQLLIGGEWRPAADGRTFESIDPSTGEAIAAAAHAGPEDVDAAVGAARAAFADDSPWRKLPAPARGQLINKLADLIEDNAQ